MSRSVPADSSPEGPCFLCLLPLVPSGKRSRDTPCCLRACSLPGEAGLISSSRARLDSQGTSPQGPRLGGSDMVYPPGAPGRRPRAFSMAGTGSRGPGRYSWERRGLGAAMIR